LIIDIWNLFVICYLLFGALIRNLFDFMDGHFIVFKNSYFLLTY